MGFASFVTQNVWIPKPEITEANVPNQAGKVHIVTGGYAGCGLELSKILYGADGTVYVAGRSPSKGEAAVKLCQETHPNSKGKVEFLMLDLSDLKTIKPAAEAFLSKETRLDVLTNNAGVMIPPRGSKDAQGYELQIGTNCIGPFLLTKLLTPILQKTAADAPEGSVRVTWAGSFAVDLLSVRPGGMALDEKGQPIIRRGPEWDYGQSKAGNLFLAAEGAKRFGKDKILHVCWNPGNLKTDLQRHISVVQKFLINPMLYPAVYGAYTELWSAVSPELTLENGGSFIYPWGRLGSCREDIQKSLKSKEEGGTGDAAKFWDWCEQATKEFA